MVFLTFLIIPVLICVFSWFLTNKITWKEFLAQILAINFIIGIMSILILNSNMSDREVWNGQITKKWTEKVSCRHSYSCHCVTHHSTSCSKRGCHTSSYTVCQTCYEHSYDRVWRTENNIKESWGINTIDRQGLREPTRWTKIEIGEATSSLHSYDNYIKGSPDSLFHTGRINEKEVAGVPEYPDHIYDYWKLNRLITIGVNVQEKDLWNKQIATISGELGSLKQVNVLIVLVKGKSHDFYYTLERIWLGGKKNDVIPVIGLDADNNILWVEVMSLSNEEFKVYLRNDLLNLNILDRDKVILTIKDNVKNRYIRKPMKDFEYLKSLIKPTKGQWVFGIILGLILSIGLSIFFYYKDPFGDDARL